MRGLIDGGADLLLLETIFDTLNAKAAIAAMLDEFEARGVELPVMISATITDRSGRTLSGQTLDAFYVSIGHARPFSVGINCALRRQPDAAVRRRAVAHRRRVRQLPSQRRAARTPSANTTRLPPETARLLREFAEAGVLNIVGGCCGTTPAHIRAIAKPSGRLPPRAATAAEHEARAPSPSTPGWRR